MVWGDAVGRRTAVIFGTGIATGLSFGALLWRRRTAVQENRSQRPHLEPRMVDANEHSRSQRLEHVHPSQPTHYVLRPGSDPRVDQAKYVRYDPSPNLKTGAILIVIPGGNYDESDIHGDEGQPVGQWFARRGITGVVLQYRCISRGHYWPAQFQDWEDCARAVRGQAASWGCDPNRIGIVGFSAGGHLAAYAALRADSEIKPKLQILVYPAIDTLSPHDCDSMEPWNAENGYPPHETSSHLLVESSAPPAFLAGIEGDKYCPVDENTDVYARELSAHGVPFKYVLHGDPEAEHGCGIQDWWSKPCEEWLHEHGWIPQPIIDASV